MKKIPSIIKKLGLVLVMDLLSQIIFRAAAVLFLVGLLVLALKHDYVFENFSLIIYLALTLIFVLSARLLYLAIKRKKTN